MSLALILGGASCLHKDFAELKALGIGDKITGVFACNDAGYEWAGELTGWVTLHPEKFNSWIKKRGANGFPPALELFSHRQPKPHIAPELTVTDYLMPGQAATGSSGLFAAKVALIDKGYDNVLLCGIPMDPLPHFYDDKNWNSAKSFRSRWSSIDIEIRERMRSMSGWSRDFLGGPYAYTT